MTTRESQIEKCCCCRRTQVRSGRVPAGDEPVLLDEHVQPQHLLRTHQPRLVSRRASERLSAICPREHTSSGRRAAAGLPKSGVPDTCSAYATRPALPPSRMCQATSAPSARPGACVFVCLRARSLRTFALIHLSLRSSAADSPLFFTGGGDGEIFEIFRPPCRVRTRVDSVRHLCSATVSHFRFRAGQLFSAGKDLSFFTEWVNVVNATTAVLS